MFDLSMCSSIVVFFLINDSCFYFSLFTGVALEAGEGVLLFEFYFTLDLTCCIKDLFTLFIIFAWCTGILKFGFYLQANFLNSEILQYLSTC